MAGEVHAIAPPPNDGMTIDSSPLVDGSPADQAQMIQMLPPSQVPEADQFRIISGWWRADADFSHDWRAEAKIWTEFRAGDHWTTEDKALLDDEERPHIVFNRVLTILKAVAGMEINGRHEVAFLPRNTEDTKVNETLSAASKWMADECDGEDEESQAFDACCTMGMGWCENRMSYEDDSSGLYVEEKISSFEMYWDRTARKKNLSDARRMMRVRRMPLSDAMAMFPNKTREQLDASWAVDGGLDYPQKSLEQKWRRDENNSVDPAYDDLAEVTIVQAQWYEREVYWLVADEATQRKAELTEKQYKVFSERMKLLRMDVEASRMTRKVYKQAFLGGFGIMLRKAGPSPIAGQFSWKCVTGELDEIKGTWFGLVKVMRDPQMWANKWLSQILHILNSTAKGGILAERAAFDDERDAEESYAKADRITWLADGALSQDKPKVMEKPGHGSVDAYVGLLTFAVSSIKDTVGINLELLGQQDINQPGILEAMRKQAGMTVLATLFDSLRRFRKQTGRARLYFIQNFLSDGRLIRVTGPEGANAVRLAKEKTTGLYDVVVADTPTSPNQKEANWQIIQPLLAVFKDQLMANPQVFAVLLEYSPLPERVVEIIKTLIKQQTDDPKKQAEEQENRQLFVASAVAKINKDQSTAEMQNAKAGTSQATAAYDIAMAQNLIQDNLRDGKFDDARAHIEAIEGVARSRKLMADADHVKAKAERERGGVMADIINARTGHQESEAAADTERAKSHREKIGASIDHLTGMAEAHKQLAAADQHKAAAEAHRAKARREDRTPATTGAA